MIPDSTVDKSDSMAQEFPLVEERDLPSKTYKMLFEKYRVRNYAEAIEAMKQAIFKIVNTERYHYNQVYSNNYGIELHDLFGMPMSYVVPEVQRRITEALLWDERITSVTNFSFDVNKKKNLLVSFTAKTIFGDVDYTNLEVSV